MDRYIGLDVHAWSGRKASSRFNRNAGVQGTRRIYRSGCEEQSVQKRYGRFSSSDEQAQGLVSLSRNSDWRQEDLFAGEQRQVSGKTAAENSATCRDLLCRARVTFGVAETGTKGDAQRSEETQNLSRVENGSWYGAEPTGRIASYCRHALPFSKQTNVLGVQATTVIGQQRKDEPVYQHYLRLLEGGTKPPLAKLTIARQIASITLSIMRTGEEYNAKGLKKK